MMTSSTNNTTKSGPTEIGGVGETYFALPVPTLHQVKLLQTLEKERKNKMELKPVTIVPPYIFGPSSVPVCI